VLVFSYVGYLTVERPINGQAVLDLSLKQDAKQLADVVVIGYGEKSRALLTESVGTVEAAAIEKLPVASADAAIQGRVSGVQITNVDGTPGSPVAIRIRGVGTVGNAQPLFVVDGVPLGNVSDGRTNPLTTINPSDIESISVLKDASAAAVYGVRAANGVVLITTKRGKTGRPRIDFDAYYGVQNFPRVHEMNSTAEYVEIATEAINNRNAQEGALPGDEDYLELPPDLRPGGSLLARNTEWERLALNENAPIQNYNVAVSGGDESANYRVSAGYFGQEATIRRWDLDRYTFRANSDYSVGKRFRFGQTFTLAYQEVNRGMNGLGDGFLYASVASMPPFFLLREDPNDPIPGNRYGYNGNLNTAGLTIGNQYGINEIVDRFDRQYRVLGGIYGELEVVQNLTFKTQVSLDLQLSRNTQWQPGYSAAELGLPRPQNQFVEGRGEGYSQVFTNTLTYSRDFGDHSLTALGGIEYQKLRGWNIGVRGGDFLSDNPAFYQSVENTGADAQASSSLSNQAFAGYIGRLSYDYREKYLVTFSYRRDGTSNFAEDRRWGNYPSVSGAWRVSEEPFFQNVPAISSLKLRGSWGQLGNANTEQFPFVSRVTFAPDYGLNGTNTVQAPSPVNFANSSVGWETVEISDFGLDASFLNDRINLLATYYIKRTKDFLYRLPISYMSGFSATSVNLGEVMNRGLELELGYNTTVARDLQLNVSGNLTTVHNELVSLAPGITEFASGNYRTAVGFPIGYFYGYETAGIYQNADQAGAALPDQFSGNQPLPGDVIFVDNNAPAGEEAPQGVLFTGEPDGEITVADRTYLGKTIPDFYYGISLNANWKGFDLSMLFQGVSGVQLYNEFRRNRESIGGVGGNLLTTTQGRWTGPGSTNSFPRAVVGDPYENNRFSDRWIENAGFFRMRNLQVGYSLPQGVLDQMNFVQRLRVYVAASNLFVITEYTGLDPEVVSFGSDSRQIEAGTDGGNIPQPRTFQAGVQVQF
ncbi:MAG: TonB-dependent receptor, partial [Catalinimonas sp.]